MNALLLPLVLLAADAANPKPAAKPDPVRVLLLTGEDFKGHKWELTAPVLKDLLAADSRLVIDVNDDLNFLRSEKLHDYDVVVMHFKNYDPEVPGRKGYDNLEKFVQRGGGLVLVHFACGAFQEFKDDFVKVAGRAWNPELRGHDKRGPFTVEITDCEHPITRGMKAFETTDELYTCLDGETPIEVLATARSNVDDKDHPMAFVLTFGRGRVFHCPLGHDVEAFSAPNVGELFRRGTTWVAEPLRAEK